MGTLRGHRPGRESATERPEARGRLSLGPNLGAFWQMEFQHPGDLDALVSKSDLSLEDTRPKNGNIFPGICACGEVAGAAYYAWQHNRKGVNATPILIEFDAPDDLVSIDGRDFLYTAFQMCDPELAGPSPALAKVFGDHILRYARRAWAMKEQSIPLCDLACYDPEVVRAHHANTVVLGGSTERFLETRSSSNCG